MAARSSSIAPEPGIVDASHSVRCDASHVALYVHDEAVLEGARRGACRFFPTEAIPPRRGRPVIDSTLSLAKG